MDEDIVNRAVNRGMELGANYAESRLEETAKEYYAHKNGNPDISQFSKTYGIAVRILVNGTFGFACTEDVSKEGVEKIVRRAVNFAKASSKIMKNPITMSEEEMFDDKYIVPQKKHIIEVAPEEKFSALSALDEQLPEAEYANRRFGLSLSYKEKYYANSEGGRLYYNVPLIHLGSWFSLKNDGQTKQAGKTQGTSGGWEFIEDPARSDIINKEVTATRKNLAEGKAPPKEPIDIITGPSVTGIAAHESCGHPYEADRILGREGAQAGGSFVTPEMIGRQIGSDLVTVYDDPTIPGLYGSYKYDDEGVKARPRTLIKEGKINEFLQNRESAGMMGMKSNAASRSMNYNREVIVRMANTHVKEGDMSVEELLEGVKKGVLINSFTEWNIDDRRYNQKYTGREAYLIENGEIKHPVVNPVLEITTPAFWGAVDGVGKDTEFVVGTCGKGDLNQGIAVTMGGPSMRLRNIRLGGV